MRVPLVGLSSPDGLEPVIRRLQTLADLSFEDMALVRRNLGEPEAYRAGHAFGGGAARRMLLSGWAARARLMADGRRQIVGFILPGDPIDLSDQGHPPLYATVALTHGASVDASALMRRLDDLPGVRLALSRADWAETARHVDHVVRLGALGAYGAMAHLLLEFHDRAAAVDLVEEGRFPVRVSQDVLGESLGLSQVHANRVLAQLRREGLLELGPGWARILDRDRMIAAAGAE